MIKSAFNLQGQFKFDVYTKDSKLKYTTEYIDNFITPTGLSYIQDFAFADCFRYLSLGTGDNPNSCTGNGGKGTTGLYSGISTGFYYIGGGGSNSCPNENNEYIQKGCGYRIDASGVTLSRAWRVPRGTDDFFLQNIDFKEYMLSPASSPATGWQYNGPGDYSPTTVCACDANIYSQSGGGNFVYGKEPNGLVNFYSDKRRGLCEGTDKAFTRIIKDISVTTDEYLVVNYGLTINFDTGIRSFLVNINRSVDAIDGDDGFKSNWSGNCSGVYSLVHPGIKLINNGDILRSDYVNNGTDHEYRYGESFIPPLGMPLEPSCPKEWRTCYLSSDNLSFLVRESGYGGMNTGMYKPYNPTGKEFPSGLLMFNKNWISETSTSSSHLGGKLPNPDTYKIYHFLSPRTDSYDAFAIWPKSSDYSEVAANAETTYYLNNFGSPSEVLNTLPYTGRNRSITLSYQYKDTDLSPVEMPVRSMVLAYKNLSDNFVYPVVDLLFAPISGTGILPKHDRQLNTGAKTYGSPSPQLSVSNSTGYFYMDINNQLAMSFNLSWSSPCPAGVEGC